MQSQMGNRSTTYTLTPPPLPAELPLINMDEWMNLEECKEDAERQKTALQKSEYFICP